MSLAEAQAKEMASAVINFGIQPSEYLQLTGYEISALVTEFNRVNKK